MRGNVETCPTCGADADLLDGTFDVAEDAVHVVFASDLTRERLALFQKILASVQAGEITFEEATEAIAAESPQFRQFFARYGPQMGTAIAAILLWMFTLLAAQAVAEHRDDSASREDVQQAFDEAVRRCQMPPADR